MAKLCRQGRQTCIVIWECPGWVGAIVLNKVGLWVSTFSTAEFSRWEEVDYPIIDAAKRYLKFAELYGANYSTLKSLREIIQGESTKEEIEMATKKKAAAKSKTKVKEEAPAEVEAPKKKSEKVSPINASGKIKLLVKDNPKRPGSASFDFFEIYKKVKTVDEFLAAGGRKADLKYDADHGFISLS